MATTLSGFILNNGGFSKKLSIIERMYGVLVDPPTKIISSILSIDKFASDKTFSLIFSVFLTRLSINELKSSWDIVKT